MVTEKGKRRDHVLAVKVTAAEKKKVMEYVKGQCVNMSALVRKLLFDRLKQDASARSDTFALFRHSLQHAAALAYLGDRDDARRRMLDLAANPGFAAYRESVEAALALPAYRPDGVVRF